ncbi:MAG: hypothetical protein AAF597_06350, partial [Bacteroidota bacterium]
MLHATTPELTKTNAIVNVPADFPTIQAAVSAAAAGDEIVVANGIYNESVNVNTAAGDITIRAANPGMATVDGGSGPAFSVANRTRDVTIDGFLLQSSMNSSSSGVIRSVNLTGRLTVSNCTFSMAGQFFTDGIYCLSDANGVPTQVSILDNTFGDWDNDQLIYIEAGDGNTTNADVDILIDGNSNTGVMEDTGVRIETISSNSTSTIVVTNNNFSGWTASGLGILVHIGDSNPVPTDQVARVLIADNVITNPDGNGIFFDVDGISTEVFAIIDNNTITGNSETSSGIFIDDDSSGQSIEATVFVTNNS